MTWRWVAFSPGFSLPSFCHLQNLGGRLEWVGLSEVEDKYSISLSLTESTKDSEGNGKRHKLIIPFLPLVLCRDGVRASCSSTVLTLVGIGQLDLSGHCTSPPPSYGEVLTRYETISCNSNDLEEVRQAFGIMPLLD